MDTTESAAGVDSREVARLITSALGGSGLELVDVEVQAGRTRLVRVVVDRPGGIDLEGLTTANRLVSAALDQADPVPGRYTLEVSSPGVERTLRTPDHFVRAIGEEVAIRTRAGLTADGERRVQGRLTAADPGGVVVEGDGLPPGGRQLSYDEIERARTVFEWGASAHRPNAPHDHPRSPCGRKQVTTS